MHHVTTITCLFIVEEIKEKKKKIDEKKKNIKVQVYYDKCCQELLKIERCIRK